MLQGYCHKNDMFLTFYNLAGVQIWFLLVFYRLIKMKLHTSCTKLFNSWKIPSLIPVQTYQLYTKQVSMIRAYTWKLPNVNLNFSMVLPLSSDKIYFLSKLKSMDWFQHQVIYTFSTYYWVCIWMHSPNTYTGSRPHCPTDSINRKYFHFRPLSWFLSLSLNILQVTT